MILTVTLNPAVDIGYKLSNLKLDSVNRTGNCSKTAGGKGLNVSRVLVQLGEDVAATGFLGGGVGSFIRENIKQQSIKDLFLECVEETRNCIAIIHGRQQTEILESGPNIKLNEADEFLELFRSYAKAVEIITISGSLPQGIDSHFYSKLIEIAHEKEARVLLDTSGKTLKASLESEFKPYLIKPNLEELSDLVGQKIKSDEEIIQALQSPLLNKIPWAVVTLGDRGAVIRYEKEIYRVKIPEVVVVNPVGSGDSVIAGFASGLSNNLPAKDAIKYGVAMGVLNAMEEKTGFIAASKIDECVESIEVELIGLVH